MSLLIVAFGQPAWIPTFGILASLIGYVPLFYLITTLESGRNRFFLGALFFALVQGIQLSWLLTHPYSYIYGIYLFLCFGIGATFGLVTYFLDKERAKKWIVLLALSALFVLLERARLHFLSGFSFNPIGLALTSTLPSLQAASLFGVYGLSFLVIFTNFAFLRLFLLGLNIKRAILPLCLALFPYVFGLYQIERERGHIDLALKEDKRTLKALLVQTAFPIEETIPFKTQEEMRDFVLEEWKTILNLIAKGTTEKPDVVVLPEYVVPFGTYVSVFPEEKIRALFLEAFGESALAAFPPLEPPLALEGKGKKWDVSNAYILQALSNLLDADVVAGLQDDQWISSEEWASFSSGFYFYPGGTVGLRYEKRVLLPMAEYIPFEFCKEMAKEYGIGGSFVPGEGAKVFPGCKGCFGLSICYEETYGDLMRDNREKGADFLINLTSDVWYPNSRLPMQHFDHARLRTVEMGIPLLRACNTGITSAFDSLGRIIKATDPEEEWKATTLFASVPLYSYSTLYSKTGDLPLISFALLACFLPLVCKRRS